jgi:hypothetical protein
VVDECEPLAEQLGEQFHGNSYQAGSWSKPNQAGRGWRIVASRSFRLADEVRYIQRRATADDSRILTIAQIVLFSTQTSDVWLLDPADRLAARLARGGESEPIHIEETDTTFTVGWKARYEINGPALV